MMSYDLVQDDKIKELKDGWIMIKWLNDGLWCTIIHTKFNNPIIL